MGVVFQFLEDAWMVLASCFMLQCMLKETRSNVVPLVNEFGVVWIVQDG